MGNLYYKKEVLELLKVNLAEAVRAEITAFSEDLSEPGNIALRNRIAGMYDLVDIVEKKFSEEDGD